MSTLLMSAVVSVSVSQHSGCDSSSSAFDYLLHVQQWPGYFGKSTNDFTMHGMWPSRQGPDESSYPCDCTSEPFDDTKLAPIAQPMNTFWPSLDGTNVAFWTHEWSKHGTCAQLPSQLDFFNTTLAWRQRTDVFGTLKSGGIVVGGAYTAAQFDAAFKQALGVTALLGCGGGQNLESVAFCIDHNATKLIECDDSVKSGSGGVVSCDRSQKITYARSAAPSPHPPGPPSPPNPGPTPDQCVPNEHGPKCSSDSDCTPYPHCIRCARSGYCTETPKITTVEV